MPIIDVRNLHKRYGDEGALEDVSFSVDAFHRADHQVSAAVPVIAGTSRSGSSSPTTTPWCATVYDKPGVRDRAAAVGEAYRRGLIG